MKNFLGIEIGGTKLQLGVGDGQTDELLELIRTEVDLAAGAKGIVAAIEEQGRGLLRRHQIDAVGIGFGGPVNVQTGVVTKSHQIHGWERYPLTQQLASSFGVPIVVDNDCNVAALGEAKFGAGQGSGRVFYVTVGTGIGGGFVVEGRLDGSARPAISEIGHLRPGTNSRSKEETVESLASGWGIERYARQLLQQDDDQDAKARLLELCGNDANQLTAKLIGVAVNERDPLAMHIFDAATNVLGWAIAQTITLLAPDVVVIGGGVSLVGAPFFERLREHVGTYVFPPLKDAFEIVPAALGEEVVVHGALQLVAGDVAN